MQVFNPIIFLLLSKYLRLQKGVNDRFLYELHNPVSLDILYGLPYILHFIFWELHTIFIIEFSSYAKRFLNIRTHIFLQRTPFLILRLRSLPLCFQYSCLISAKINRGYYTHKLLRMSKVTIFNAHQANYMTPDTSG